MKNTNRIFSLFAALALFAGLSFGQATTTQTTVSQAIGQLDQVINLTSVTGILGPALLNNAQTFILVDTELMYVNGAVSGNMVPVLRGQEGSRQVAHANGVVAWYGSPTWFGNAEQTGGCTATSLINLPKPINPSGNVYNCINSQWYLSIVGRPNGFTDATFFVPPSSCYSSVSGNSAGTNGLTVAGASNTPVIQASTSNSGTNTHTYVCVVQLPTRLQSGRGVQITDVTPLYGVQTSALGTQANTLASGTFNSSIVFSNIAFPVAAASETASTVTPVRADAGTMVVAPVAASFNTATTTAGGFYSAKFAPASPILMNTDLQSLLFTFTLQCAATSATITNLAGLQVHYINVPL